MEHRERCNDVEKKRCRDSRDFVLCKRIKITIAKSFQGIYIVLNQMRHPTGSSSGAILRSGDISFENDRETGDLLTVVQPYCSEKCAAELKTN